MTGPQLGKEALLDAAAILFDEQGVDAVSMNRVIEASGHRNRSAAAYHFGGKEEVVRALVRRSMTVADERRASLLDELERRTPSPAPRPVLVVALTPLAESLQTIEGRRYLRLAGQLVGHPRWYATSETIPRVNASLARCAAHLLGVTAHLPEELRVERVAQIGTFISRAFADQARLIDTEAPTRPVLSTAAFTTNLIDLVLAMLTVPATPPDATPDTAPR